MKSRKERKRRESPIPPFQGRRKIKNLTVTDDLRKKFQEGNKRKQKLPVRAEEKGEVKLTSKFYSSRKAGIV